LKNLFTAFAKHISVFVFYFLLPVLPLLLTIAFAKPKFVFNYWQTIGKLLIYIEALKEGPLQHYFQDVIGLENEVPATIQGSCIKCGNCCLNKRCVFLEQTSETEFQCGIYTSPFRKFSNCNSFPLNAQDIARYDCPSYFISQQTPPARANNQEKDYAVHWIQPNAYPTSAKMSENAATLK
jgi:hypothetical protein